jgi:hypothetical protein
VEGADFTASGYWPSRSPGPIWRYRRACERRAPPGAARPAESTASEKTAVRRDTAGRDDDGFILKFLIAYPSYAIEPVIIDFPNNPAHGSDRGGMVRERMSVKTCVAAVTGAPAVRRSSV